MSEGEETNLSFSYRLGFMSSPHSCLVSQWPDGEDGEKAHGYMKDAALSSMAGELFGPTVLDIQTQLF